MIKNASPKATVSFVSLGCSKNLVDSERMLGLLAQDGFALVPEGQQADLVVVNTCGFIDAARQESCGVIEEMLGRKRAGEVRGVIVAGCLAERQKDALLEQFPDVDQVVGVFGREEIAKVSDRFLGGLREQRTLFRPAPVQAQDDRARLRITPRHLAYLKVSEGCDRLCTFCAIPYMRGKHVTKPIERVVEEARELAGDGVRELVLVAQDMTYYGLDLYGRPRLAELLRALDQVEGIDWIRVLYCYPQFFTEELYETLGHSRKILPYLDMPLQHINDRLMAGQQPVAVAVNRGLVGRTLDVLIDAPAPEGRYLWLGRTYADAPDVDGVTWVRGTDLRPGDLVACEVVDADGYDLVARAPS